MIRRHAKPHKPEGDGESFEHVNSCFFDFRHDAVRRIKAGRTGADHGHAERPVIAASSRVCGSPPRADRRPMGSAYNVAPATTAEPRPDCRSHDDGRPVSRRRIKWSVPVPDIADPRIPPSRAPSLARRWSMLDSGPSHRGLRHATDAIRFSRRLCCCEDGKSEVQVLLGGYLGPRKDSLLCASRVHSACCILTSTCGVSGTCTTCTCYHHVLCTCTTIARGRPVI